MAANLEAFQPIWMNFSTNSLIVQRRPLFIDERLADGCS
ncbi:hypothetical protein Lbys_0284 [Leadbetterella byssophila DSM 17132]|uniref:Uncharacterized protein n=1 Tax=Leadbetterella byssophila (strain DSM 17132 / JCM 16389 / KACC 11308 / NBRC 106382 / 4M15) TaxID=649349 RepID=E4RUR7_LEAB4|nr:hypothetical protein Lbys_0284 [Leadbetterella byssophila DSM 17132]